MWRKFIVSADKEEWEGVWDNLMWLRHKVKAQYHHSRDFLVTGSAPSQRDRLMYFFRNCGEILQRERAASAAAAEKKMDSRCP